MCLATFPVARQFYVFQFHKAVHCTSPISYSLGEQCNFWGRVKTTPRWLILSLGNQRSVFPGGDACTAFRKKSAVGPDDLPPQ